MGTRKPCGVDNNKIKHQGLIVNEASDLSAHRTRSNRWPTEPEPAPHALIVAVDAVYQALEDRQ